MKQLLNLGIAFIFTLTLAACGGGGGGGGGSDAGGSSGGSSVSYTGSTAPADLTESNSKEVSGGATEMGNFGGSASLVAGADTETELTGRSILNHTAINSIIKKLNADTSATAAVSNFSDSTPGSCGGTSSISMSIDDVSYNFSGTLSFSNFCQGDITLNGSASLSGNVSGSTITFTMNIASLVVSDASTGLVYKAENYVTAIATDTSVSYMTVTISGRFYHPTYGYVLVSTPDPLRYSGTSIWPYSGTIKVIEEGPGSVDSATLTALNSTQYQLDVDLGNDGTVDSSTIGNWTDL